MALADISDNSEHPASERFRLLQMLEAEVSFQEALLGEFFCLLPVTNDSSGNSQGILEVPIVEDSEGFFGAGERQVD